MKPVSLVRLVVRFDSLGRQLCFLQLPEVCEDSPWSRQNTWIERAECTHLGWALCKLEGKEKAIRNLHNWCRFINEKLHRAERSLSEHEESLEASKEAVLRLENKTKDLSNTIASQGSELKEANSKYISETSRLRRQLQLLQQKG